MSFHFDDSGGQEEVKPLSLPAAFLAGIGGMSPDRLARCTSEERTAGVRTGAAVLVMMAAIWGIWFTTLSVVIDPSDTTYYFVCVAAAVPAILIGMMDQTILQGLWFRAGDSDARKRGFSTHKSDPQDKRKRRYGTIFRLLISGAVGYILASFLSLVIFERDIAAEIQRTTRNANSQIVASATQRVDAEIAEFDVRSKALDGEIREMEALAAKKRQSEAAQIAAANEAYDKRRQQLLAEKDAQTQVAIDSRKDAIAEENGLSGKPNYSGVPGRKHLYQGAVQNAELAEKRVAELVVELDALAKQHALNIAAAPGDGSPELSQFKARQDTLRTERDRLVGSREKAIQQAVETDPNYVSKADGLIIRMKALDRLEEDWAVFRKVLFIEILLTMLEMSAILVKILFPPPAVYSLKTVIEYEIAAAAEIAMAEEKIARSTVKRIDALEIRDTALARREQSIQERKAAQGTRFKDVEANDDFPGRTSHG